MAIQTGRPLGFVIAGAGLASTVVSFGDAAFSAELGSMVADASVKAPAIEDAPQGLQMPAVLYDEAAMNGTAAHAVQRPQQATVSQAAGQHEMSVATRRKPQQSMAMKDSQDDGERSPEGKSSDVLAREVEAVKVAIGDVLGQLDDEGRETASRALRSVIGKGGDLEAGKRVIFKLVKEERGAVLTAFSECAEQRSAIGIDEQVQALWGVSQRPGYFGEATEYLCRWKLLKLVAHWAKDERDELGSAIDHLLADYPGNAPEVYQVVSGHIQRMIDKGVPPREQVLTACEIVRAFCGPIDA